MKKFGLILASLFLSPGLFAQNPTQPQPDVDTKSIHIHQLLPPNPPGNVTTQYTGTPGPNAKSFYYWLVSNFTVGNSTPGGPYQVFNVPATLTSGNYFTIFWAPVAGANSYDLLRTSTANQPSGACNCAVATGITGLSQTDQSNSLNSYTVNTYNANDAIQYLVSDNVGGAGYLQEHLLLKQKNQLICDLSLCGSGGGGITSFSSGNLPPLFTTSVATPTTTPALSFVLTNAGAQSYFGNNTSSSGAPSYIANNGVCMMNFGADNASNPLASLDIGPQTKKCQIPYTVNGATVQEIDVTGDPSDTGSSVVIGKRHCTANPCASNYTITNLVSAALSTATGGGPGCAKTGATAGIDGFTTCVATLQNTTLAPGDWIETVSATADGNALAYHIAVRFTH